MQNNNLGGDETTDYFTFYTRKYPNIFPFDIKVLFIERA